MSKWTQPYSYWISTVPLSALSSPESVAPSVFAQAETTETRKKQRTHVLQFEGCTTDRDCAFLTSSAKRAFGVAETPGR